MPGAKILVSAAVAPRLSAAVSRSVCDDERVFSYLAKGTDTKILPQNELSYLYRWLFHGYDCFGVKKVQYKK